MSMYKIIGLTDGLIAGFSDNEEIYAREDEKSMFDEEVCG